MQDSETARIREEKAFWNRFAHRYDRFIGTLDDRYRQIFETAAGLLDPEKDLLEVATGTGLLSMQLARHCRKIIACDLSEEMIRVADAKIAASGITNISFEVRDAYNMPYPDNSFDVVLASNTLHVMTEPERALASIRRVVKDNGRVFLPTYCHGQNFRSRTVSRIMSLTGFRAYHKWDATGFRLFIESAGFRILEWTIVADAAPLVLPVLALEV